jgi:protoporphyrinogen/coproporphyrinogen III oxidase
VTSDGETLACRSLTLAVPPDAATALMPAGMDAARAAIADIDVAEIETLVLVFRTSDLGLKPIAGLIASRRRLLLRRLAGLPCGSELPRIRLPLPSRRARRSGAGRARLHRTRHDTASRRRPSTRAQSTAGTARRTRRAGKRLDEALAGTRLAVTGNWFLGVSIEDALTRSRSESDRLFAA